MQLNLAPNGATSAAAASTTAISGEKSELDRALMALRRAETGMTHAIQVAVAASTVLTTEASNVSRAIELMDQYLAGAGGY